MRVSLPTPLEAVLEDPLEHNGGTYLSLKIGKSEKKLWGCVENLKKNFEKLKKKLDSAGIKSQKI